MTDHFEWEEKDEETPFFLHMIGTIASLSFFNRLIPLAGSFAGVTEHCLLLPFDNLKTNAQVIKANTAQEISKLVQKIYSSGGFKRFWSGASVIASGCVPAHAAYFSIFEFAKKRFIDHSHPHIQPHIYALTGAMATVVHDCIITPFDVIKQRRQILREPSRKILSSLIKTEGILSLYRSLPITMTMNIPWASILVGVNETLKQLVLTENNHTFSTYFCCAALAASIASACTIPLDNVKTRLQTQTCFKQCGKEMVCGLKCNSMQHSFDFNKCKQLFFKSKIFCIGRTAQQAFTTNKLKELRGEKCMGNSDRIKYRNISESIKIIYKEEGIRGFTKGIVPRICGQAPSAATSWAAYETIKGLLEKRWIHHFHH